MPYVGYAFIIYICLLVILVSLNWKDSLQKEFEKYYPIFLYIAGAGMVLMTSMAGQYLTGSDIHLEYYYAQLHSGMDVLPPLLGIPQGTSIAHTIIAPLLGNIIPLLWVYKLVYPLLFSLVPVICYFIFQNWVTKKQALLASFVLISFPSFFMELPAVARHMVGELILVMLLFLLMKSSLRTRYRIPLISICGILMALTYYTVTIMAMVILTIFLLVSLFQKRRRILITVGLASMLITSSIYYPIIEDGAVARKLGHIYNAYVPTFLELNFPKMKVPIPVLPSKRVEVIDDKLKEVPQGKSLPEIKEPPGTSEKVGELSPPDVWASKIPFIKRYGPLMESGLGVDFLDTSIPGKIFRILQWLFMLLIPIGLWRFRKNRNYWMFGSGGIILIILTLIPNFTGLLSATRMVHMTLLFLAPAIAISLRPRYLLLILIPYFLFTSGFIFESIKQPNIEQITIPYSYGLSNYRIDLGASINNDDFKVRQYIYDNKLFPTSSDINGADFIGEIVGWRSTWNLTFRTFHGIYLPEEGYFFITSRNAEDGTFTLWTGAGLREHVPIETFGIDIDKNIIYQSGNSRVLSIR